MNRTRLVGLILLLLLLAAPYAMLIVVGGMWLHEHGIWWWWAIAAATISTTAWGIARWQFRSQPAFEPVVSEDELLRLSPAATAAAEDVDKYISGLNVSAISLDSTASLREPVQQVVELVARRFSPNSSSPMLEVPIPQALRILELVAADLRVAIATHVPGSHLLRIGDLQRISSLSKWLPFATTAYRVAVWITDPAAAVMNEVRRYGETQFLDASTATIKDWLVRYALQRTAFYAIQLYSGRLVIQESVPATFQASETQRDQTAESRRDAAIDAEPLRVLVAGQAKAGKSSLINAVFGETVTATDVLPETRGVIPFTRRGESQRSAIIFDTVGYGVSENDTRETLHAIGNIDLILLVCSATTAAREADRRFLEAVAAYSRDERYRVPPAIISVVTHIDLLRPVTEWSPPYDLRNPKSAKAQNILAATMAVAEDLKLDVSSVVPICTHPDRLDNVTEGLLPVVFAALGGGERARYLRALQAFRSATNWSTLRDQGLATGRIIGSAAVELWNQFRN